MQILIKYIYYYIITINELLIWSRKRLLGNISIWQGHLNCILAFLTIFNWDRDHITWSDSYYLVSLKENWNQVVLFERKSHFEVSCACVSPTTPNMYILKWFRFIITISDMSLLVYYVICVICMSKKLKYLKNKARESRTER